MIAIGPRGIHSFDVGALAHESDCRFESSWAPHSRSSRAFVALRVDVFVTRARAPRVVTCAGPPALQDRASTRRHTGCHVNRPQTPTDAGASATLLVRCFPQRPSPIPILPA